MAIMNGFCGMTLARFTSPAWLICCTTCAASICAVLHMRVGAKTGTCTALLCTVQGAVLKHLGSFYSLPRV